MRSFCTFFIGGLLTLAVMVFSPFSTFALDRLYMREAPPLFAYFDPVDELRLQAAIATEEAQASTADERLKLLPGIEIRTALEDYSRLHWELG